MSQGTQTSLVCACPLGSVAVAGEGCVSIQGLEGCANKLPNIYSFQESNEGLDQQEKAPILKLTQETRPHLPLDSI